VQAEAQQIRSVVELGDVVSLNKERASFPIFRHNSRAAEMVTAELAGSFEAPVYGMLAVRDAINKADWGPGQKPEIKLHGQPDDESKPTLLWDGEWEVTYVTFRDMGAAFGVAILGIYFIVAGQFGSFKLPRDPDPRSAHAHRDYAGALAFRGAVHGDLDDRLHRARWDHRCSSFQRSMLCCGMIAGPFRMNS